MNHLIELWSQISWQQVVGAIILGNILLAMVMIAFSGRVQDPMDDAPEFTEESPAVPRSVSDRIAMREARQLHFHDQEEAEARHG